MRTSTTHLAVGGIAVVGSSSIMLALHQPTHNFALTVAAVGVIVCAITCTGMVLYTRLFAVIRCLREEIAQIRRVAGRIASVEYDVLRELKDHNSGLN